MLAALRFRIPPSTREASRRRPVALGGIERELACDPPRPYVWSAPPATRYTEPILAQGHARRAWIVGVRRWRDDEGPEVRAWLAFEGDGGRLVVVYRRWSIDGYHGYVGAPTYMDWFDATIVPGGTLTVLYPRGRPGRAIPYGDLDPHIAGAFAAK